MRKRDWIFIGTILLLLIYCGYLRYEVWYSYGYAKTYGEMVFCLQKKHLWVHRQLICCLKTNKALEEEIGRLKLLPNSAKVTVTCYNSHPSQTDRTPEITAFNTKTGPGTVAVSRDLLDKGFVPFSKVWIEGFGIYTINDIMNKRYENRVDIWIDKKAKVFKKEDVRIVGFCDCAKNTDA